MAVVIEIIETSPKKIETHPMLVLDEQKSRPDTACRRKIPLDRGWRHMILTMMQTDAMKSELEHLVQTAFEFGRQYQRDFPNDPPVA